MERIREPVPVPAVIGPLYTTREVATFLRVSQRTVEKWIQRGELPALRYGTQKRVRQEDIVAFGALIVSRSS
jgi:excisionase family DNA binding protein